MLRGAVCTQVVVQGIPWAYTDQDLAGLFHEVGTVEQASVVYSKDGRSRVRPLISIASLQSWSTHGLSTASAQARGKALLLAVCLSGPSDQPYLSLVAVLPDILSLMSIAVNCSHKYDIHFSAVP